MPPNNSAFCRRNWLWLLGAFLFSGLFFSASAQTVTNLHQLTEMVETNPRISYQPVHLEVTVCAASRPEVGVVIVKDTSGVELLEMGNLGSRVEPGDQIRIQGWVDFFRKREMGIEIKSSPLVDNDGLHIRRTWFGNSTLGAGWIPIQLDWFNCLKDLNLEVSAALTNVSSANLLTPSNLYHAEIDVSGHTNFLPGLRAKCYEGYWETVPDFSLLQPVKSGIVSNFDVGFRSRDEQVGIHFSGYWKVPEDGQYQFALRSDDGSLLYLIKPELPIVHLGKIQAPVPQRAYFGEVMSNMTARKWLTLEGRVGFVAKDGMGFKFDLRSDRDVITVRVADADGLDLARLQDSHVRVSGVGRPVLTSDMRLVLGKLNVASSQQIQFIQEISDNKISLPITSVQQVQSLPIQDARQGLPVRLRGVVTSARNSVYERWMSFQDDTRGIFVSLTGITNAVPGAGQFWEVEGHSGAGDFAPIVVADKMTFLGTGRLPEPVHPTWTELLNGSMDVQWAELQGLVTDVNSNQVTLLLPEGRLRVLMDGYDTKELKPFLKAVVCIRGVLYAEWNAATREVRVGSVTMRNSVVSVETPAPADPFNAVVKTPRELLLFDTQATAFRRVKVQGQVVYADDAQLCLEQGGMGLRILLSTNAPVQPGDLVEAVGYPDIGRVALSLREAQVRKTGQASLVLPKKLTDADLTQNDLDSTRVSLKGKLIGWHSEQGIPVLEMQSGSHLYLARFAHEQPDQFPFRMGSLLKLNGVYVGGARSEHSNADAESFEIWLNSPDDITILSQPSWWTLQRLLILVGLLLVILSFTVIWISQLRRLVEQRTTQLQKEIHERERVERQHEIEAERSRIARDLHDDLGSSLTEISVLASTGERPVSPDANHPSLFRAIAGKARSLIAALDVIVWAIDPEDNSLQSLADYLTGYTEEFFSHTTISCRFKVPVAFPIITLEGRLRHDLLMAVKEALNNIVRHSHATEVEFRMAIAGDDLEIEITDNGIGFEGAQNGHGLKNLPARLAKINGFCTVTSHGGSGTVVKIHLPLSANVPAKINA